MYRPDFRKPIRDAFFLTASVGRPSSAATSAVGRLENSFLSRRTSSLVHDPFILVLAISWLLFSIFRGLTRGERGHRPVFPRCLCTYSFMCTHQKARGSYPNPVTSSPNGGRTGRCEVLSSEGDGRTGPLANGQLAYSHGMVLTLCLLARAGLLCGLCGFAPLTVLGSPSSVGNLRTSADCRASLAMT